MPKRRTCSKIFRCIEQHPDFGDVSDSFRNRYNASPDGISVFSQITQDTLLYISRKLARFGLRASELTIGHSLLKTTEISSGSGSVTTMNMIALSSRNGASKVIPPRPLLFDSRKRFWDRNAHPEDRLSLS